MAARIVVVLTLMAAILRLFRAYVTVADTLKISPKVEKGKCRLTSSFFATAKDKRHKPLNLAASQKKNRPV